MVRIKIGGTCDPLERLLMQLVQDWDELERWAFRYYSTDEKAKIAREEKRTVCMGAGCEPGADEKFRRARL